MSKSSGVTALSRLTRSLETEEQGDPHAPTTNGPVQPQVVQPVVQPQVVQPVVQDEIGRRAAARTQVQVRFEAAKTTLLVSAKALSELDGSHADLEKDTGERTFEVSRYFTATAARRNSRPNSSTAS